MVRWRLHLTHYNTPKIWDACEIPLFLMAEMKIPWDKEDKLAMYSETSEKTHSLGMIMQKQVETSHPKRLTSMEQNLQHVASCCTCRRESWARRPGWPYMGNARESSVHWGFGSSSCCYEGWFHTLTRKENKFPSNNLFHYLEWPSILKSRPIIDEPMVLEFCLPEGTLIIIRQVSESFGKYKRKRFLLPVKGATTSLPDTATDGTNN